MINLISAIKIGVNDKVINFIIYEDNKRWQKYYKDVILKIIGHSNDKYKIIVIDKYDNEIIKKINSLDGKKIFLLDLQVPGKSGLEFAREIRRKNDWKSQIIVITSYDNFKNEGYSSRILMLDFICKKDNVYEKLSDSINIALKIHQNTPSYNFTFNNEYYQIPYEDILFFEKDLNNNYVNIITKHNRFKIKESLINIEQQLNKNNIFYKTHRSCVVNISNIKKVDLSNNIIYFKNKKTYLLARNKKKELKDLLTKEYNYDVS